MHPCSALPGGQPASQPPENAPVPASSPVDARFMPAPATRPIRPPMGAEFDLQATAFLCLGSLSPQEAALPVPPRLHDPIMVALLNDHYDPLLGLQLVPAFMDMSARDESLHLSHLSDISSTLPTWQPPDPGVFLNPSRERQ
jgi:hypothetical protein